MLTATDEIDSKTASATHLSRDQILSATAQCLRDFGYDATTIRKIASILRCAVGSIYRYFHDKRELLSEVSQQQMQPVVEYLKEGGSFDQSVRIYLQRASDDPKTYRLMFWLACIGPELQSAHENTPNACSLPDIIQQIVHAWGQLLDYPDRAKECWGIVHGGLLLGHTHEQIVARIKELCNLTPVSSPMEVEVPAAELPPRPKSPLAVVADPVTIGSIPHDLPNTIADDVCLL